MENQEFLDLIGKLLSNNISEIERSKLEALLEDNEEDQILFEKLKRAWKLFGQMETTYQPKSKETWQAMLDKVEKVDDRSNNHRANKEYSKRRKTVKFPAYYYAAAAAVMLLLVVGYSFLVGPNVNLITNETLALEKKTVVLPDGSEVWMNELSKIEYEETFQGETREVFLTGEAFFKVKRDENKPFIIYTNKTKTQVLGTSFNVYAPHKSKKEEVTVVTGKVAFTRKDKPNQSIILNPGDKGVFTTENTSLAKIKNDNINFLSWQNEKLVFEDTYLKEVFKTLSDYFHVKIETTNVKILNCTFTSTFNNPQLEEILKVLSITVDMSYKKTGNNYVISGKGCD